MSISRCVAFKLHNWIRSSHHRVVVQDLIELNVLARPCTRAVLSLIPLGKTTPTHLFHTASCLLSALWSVRAKSTDWGGWDWFQIIKLFFKSCCRFFFLTLKFCIYSIKLGTWVTNNFSQVQMLCNLLWAPCIQQLDVTSSVPCCTYVRRLSDSLVLILLHPNDLKFFQFFFLKLVISCFLQVDLTLESVHWPISLVMHFGHRGIRLWIACLTASRTFTDWMLFCILVPFSRV